MGAHIEWLAPTVTVVPAGWDVRDDMPGTPPGPDAETDDTTSTTAVLIGHRFDTFGVVEADPAELAGDVLAAHLVHVAEEAGRDAVTALDIERAALKIHTHLLRRFLTTDRESE